MKLIRTNAELNKQLKRLIKSWILCESEFECERLAI